MPVCARSASSAMPALELVVGVLYCFLLLGSDQAGGAAVGQGGTCSGQTRDGEAVLAALLPLHSGSNCSVVQLRGAQQEAAVRAAVDKVNRALRREALSIGLRVLDTCSSADETVKATMRALVAADQTCLHPPLFLGLIGPEDAKSLSAALRVTDLFGTVHLVPWGRPDTDAEGNQDVLNVAQYEPLERAQGILLVLRRLGWPSFLLVQDSDEASSSAAKELTQLVESETDICVEQRVVNLSADLRGYGDAAWMISKDKSGGVVIVSESVDRAYAVLSQLSTLPLTGPGGVVHALVSTRRMGPGATQLARQRGLALTLVVEATPSHLVPDTQRVLLAESPLWSALSSFDRDSTIWPGLNPDFQDVSVGPLIIGVHLLAAAFRVAHRIKCPLTPALQVFSSSSGLAPGSASGPPRIFCPALLDMAPDEWRSILERVTAFPEVTVATQSKFRFSMELSTTANVFVKRLEADSFEKIGFLVAGKELQLESPRVKFPPVRPGVDSYCGATRSAGSAEIQTRTTPMSLLSTKSKNNRGSDKTTRTTPQPQQRESDSGGGGLNVDWSWIFGGSSEGVFSSKDYDFYQMLYMLVGAAAVMLVIFLLCFCIVYRCFRSKSSEKDTISNSSRKSRISRASSKSSDS